MSSGPRGFDMAEFRVRTAAAQARTEEDIVITEGRAKFLSTPQDHAIRVI